MIRFEHVGFHYPDASAPTLTDVDLHIGEGELVLVVGPTGSGKSTLLRAVNGLVPHFTGGHLTGTVSVFGRDTATHRPNAMADLVGVVGQDPMAGFVTDVVEDELAYGMESLGVPPAVMRVRVEEVLDLLGLADVRSRPLAALSGGQRQRTAIAAAMTMRPRVLVLDEPTSALDPTAAEEVLAAVQRLVGDLAMTVLIAEHRLERVVQYADRVAVVDRGRVRIGAPAEVLADSPVAPPVVELGRWAGWTPLPLSVRDARRRAVGDDWPARLAAGQPDSQARLTQDVGHTTCATRLTIGDGEVVSEVRDLVVTRPGLGRPAVDRVSLTLRAGEVTALMGRNGAGKSSLLEAMAGLLPYRSGRIRHGDLDPGRARAADVVRRIGLVPQDPTDLLYSETVAAECRAADSDFTGAPGTCAALLARLAPESTGWADLGPRDLSEGQRLCLALAVVLSGRPRLVALDEPTRGLDYPAKARLTGILRDLAAEGHAVLLATHDVELVAEVADRVLVMADGELVADGATREVVTGSAMLAPQVAKVTAPAELLTVGAVTERLAPAGSVR